MLTTQPIDFDSPWKEALEEFIALFLPEAHAEIDWSRPPVFLDKELQQVVREAALGRRIVDKLVHVWLRGGQDAWVLVHIEVQTQEEEDFAERMYAYSSRLYNRFGRHVVSVAVLGDENPSWRPARYVSGRWGCSLEFAYPVIKLLDYRKRPNELEASDNPFATVVLAHLAAQETRGDVDRRQGLKLALTRRLYERGYTREQIIKLYRFIDWLLALPEEREQQVWREIRSYEEERQMPYITSAERIGMEQGLQQGRAEGHLEGKREALRRVIRARFGTLPEAVERRIAVADETDLDALLERAVMAPSIEDL
jgi:hypothetical protein